MKSIQDKIRIENLRQNNNDLRGEMVKSKLLLEECVEVIENIYERDTELTKKVRNFLYKEVEGKSEFTR